MSSSQNLRKIQTQIVRYSLGDFSGRIRFNGTDEYWDAVSVSLNMLGEELKEITVSKEFFLNIFNTIPDQLLITDSNGLVMTSNREATMATGISTGRQFDEFYTGVGGGTFAYLKKTYRHSNEPQEFPLQRIGRQDQYFTCRITALQSPGKISRFIVLIKDITSREIARQQLAASEQRFREIFQNSSDGILLVDSNGVILQTNASFRQLCNCNEQDHLELKQVLRLPGAKSFTRHHLARFCKGITNREVLVQNLHGGESYVCLLSSVPLGIIDGIDTCQLMIKNISQYREHNKQLMRAVNEQQERERTRIANDLHDSVGQHLSSLKFMISTVQKMISGKQEREMLKDMSASISMVVDELRTVSFDLMPGTLHHFGLRRTIEELLDRMQKIYPLVAFKFYPPKEMPHIPQEAKLHFYRIIQEFMANSLKHADPLSISITIFVSNGRQLILKLEDDGSGFNLRSAMKGSTRGLHNIISRTDSVGGHVRMKTAPGEGTSFIITIPIA